MANAHGEFVWYELVTPDLDAAAAFYGAVLGWQVSSAGQPGLDYRIIRSGKVDVGGMLALTPAMTAGGARPAWIGYVGVDDVDASVAAIARAGGTVLMSAWDVPNVGRMAMVADPHGVPFYVMRGVVDGTSRAFSADAIGHCAWNELTTPDPAAALAFYLREFGWQRGDAMPMGELGEYRFIQAAGRTIGAVAPSPPEGPTTGWTYYFRVADVDVAIARVTAGGGRIVHGPSEVPGNQHIVHGVDPQGAGFALVGARR